MNDHILLLCGQLFKQASRCAMYALRAEQDQRPDLALLFTALAESHSRQGRRFLFQVRGSIGHTPTNRTVMEEDELPGLIALFEELGREAERTGSRALATGSDHSLRIARMNRSLLARLRDQPQSRSYHVCDFCGFVAVDTAPDNCPICTAPRRRFIPFQTDR